MLLAPVAERVRLPALVSRGVVTEVEKVEVTPVRLFRPVMFWELPVIAPVKVAAPKRRVPAEAVMSWLPVPEKVRSASLPDRARLPVMVVFSSRVRLPVVEPPMVRGAMLVVARLPSPVR